MKQISRVLGFGALALSLNATADVLGGSVEVSYWQGGYSGQVISVNEVLDLEDNLNLDDGGFLEIAATFEHPVPVLPNIRLKHISLDESANGTFTGTFDGENYGGDIATDLDLTHSDLILYYEILDNYVSVVVGLDVKKFDGKMEIRDSSDATQVSVSTIDDVLPMIYVAAEVELPLTGLSVGAEVSAIKYSGDSLQDAKVKLRQGFGLAFVELGYRQISIDIEDVSDVDVDVDLSGAYLSTGIDF